MSAPRLLVFVLALAAGLRLSAQTLTSLRSSGPRDHNVNFVFLGDGYTAAESTKFVTDATAKLNMLLANESWSPFAGLINADAIFVASAESGADDPATNTVRDTYFNSTFGYLGVQRLLGIDATGSSRLFTLLLNYTPDYDVVILLVNSTQYGGAGGFPTISSLSVSPSSDEIVLHELGHSFARLADEYTDAASASVTSIREYPNATQQAAPSLIPWRLFIQPGTLLPTVTALNEDTVGLFPGSYYRATGYYRPTFNSKMYTLGRPFGPVNLRAFANGIHRLNLNAAMTPPVISQQPAGAVVASGQSFTLGVTVGGVGPFTYQWLFNSSYIVNATGPTLTVTNMGPAKAGAYAVEVTNAFDAVTSSAATVTLPPSAPFNAQVQASASVLAVGGSITFTCTVEGTAPFTYQWQKNGANLSNGGIVSGATSATLTLTGVTSADTGNYAVVVSNALGATVSNPANLIVAVPVTAPTNARISIQAL